MRKALRGDLDWIVLKALTKERDRRYVSAADLGADLRRFLRNEPVDASPPSAAYRIGKFVRRHRVAVTAAALLVLTLMAGTVGTTAGMLRARRAEAAARTEAATAERYSTFLVNMFETAAPEQSKGRDDHGAGACPAGRRANPHRARQRAAARSAAARHHRLGLHPAGTLLGRTLPLDDAVALARKLGDRGNVDLAQALYRRGQAERYLDEPIKAESDDREALAILERTYGPERREGRAGPDRAWIAVAHERSRASAPFVSPAATTCWWRPTAKRTAPPPCCCRTSARFTTARDRYRDAKDAYEQALPLLRRNFGEQDHHVGTVLGNLAQLYQILGDYHARLRSGAARSRDRHSRVRSRIIRMWASTGCNLARISDKLGDQRLAVEQIDRAGAIFGQRLPDAHPLRLYAAYFKAGFLIELGQLGDARTLLEQLVATQQPSSLEARVALLNGWVRLAEHRAPERTVAEVSRAR